MSGQPDQEKVSPSLQPDGEPTPVQKVPKGVLPPPDGDLRAWMQCAAGFCVFFISAIFDG
jgi:hypothetical protein